MDATIKAKVRTIYYELQGYLSQTPKPQHTGDIFVGDAPWKQYNQAIEELSKITDDDYSRFMITTELSGRSSVVRLVTYRQTLGGVINRIHGLYFSDEDMPFSGSPQTIISQNQSQTQSIQMLLDFQSKIDEEINKTDDPKKKGFLNTVKTKLGQIKNVNELLSLFIKTAKEFNLNLSDLGTFFG